MSWKKRDIWKAGKGAGVLRNSRSLSPKIRMYMASHFNYRAIQYIQWGPNKQPYKNDVIVYKSGILDATEMTKKIKREVV